MQVQLDFGRSGITVALPVWADAVLLETKRNPAVANPSAAVADALAAPIGTPPLAVLARGKRRAVVVVSDKTRPVPYRVLLPPLLRTLRDAGLPAEQVEILVATGLHRANTLAELEEMLGANVVRTYPVRNHVARDEDAHEYLGTTSQGTEIWIDRGYLRADLRILTGLIEPHLMAGYSGGRKALCPGLAGVRTMRSAHGPTMLEGHVGPGILQGNPFHEDLLEIVAHVGADFLCDVTIDRMRRITGVYAGDVVQAHLAGAEALEQQVLVTLPESVDVVLTSAGGYPLDQTLYQAIKGLTTALNIVRPGGAIVLVAELSEGAGSAEFVRLLQSVPSPDAFMEQLLQPGFFQLDQWMVQHLCQVLRKASVWIVSHHKVVEFRDGFAIRWAASAETALAEIKERFPQARSVAVIPEGSYTLPTVRGVKMPLGTAWKLGA